ncbi:transposase, partial [Micromonospora sp. LZ34]
RCTSSVPASLVFLPGFDVSIKPGAEQPAGGGIPSRGRPWSIPITAAQYTSWAFGQRLRSAGLLGSMGSIGDCYDNSLVESFFCSMQLELLDRQPWATRQELANAIFEWIEAWNNPRRRHSSLGNLSPIDYEQQHTPAATAA